MSKILNRQTELTVDHLMDQSHQVPQIQILANLPNLMATLQMLKG